MSVPALIRRARPADADGIASVHVRSWRAAYRGLIAQDVLDGLSVPERAEGWRRILGNPEPTSLGTLIAVRDGAILGWTSVGLGRDGDLPGDGVVAGSPDGEVYGLYADPDAWSTGIGHALLAAAEQRLRDAGHRRAYLWVLDGNERADDFYARHGWSADGATKAEERPGLMLPEHRRVKTLVG